MQQRLTVTEATSLVKQCIEDGLRPLWVEGEITNFVAHSSGHHYFSLKDAGAQLRCVMFRGANRRLRFRPEDGMQCALFGRLTIYAPSGLYQLVAERMLPIGEGELQLAFEALRERLAQEGLFDPLRKQALPTFPRTIGVVTSPTGAAIRDIVKVLRRRWPPVRIILRPVRVQGRGAAAEIATGIADLARLDDVDLLIVGRGGGSLEDLWAFNEEPTARAIAASRIPVISAVGHEIDHTIADLAADQRAATPSAAAEIAVPDVREIYAEVRAVLERCGRATTKQLTDYHLRLDALARSRALQSPQERLQLESQRADELLRRAGRCLDTRLARTRDRLEALKARIDALNPGAVLGRGFALAFDGQGRILRSAAAIDAGDPLRVRLGRGTVWCRAERRDLEEEQLDGQTAEGC